MYVDIFSYLVWDLKNHKVTKYVSFCCTTLERSRVLHILVSRKIPVYYDMSNVTLASDDRSILVSYENRVGGFPVNLEVHDLISRI